MSEGIAISVRNLTKSYRLYHSPLDQVKEMLHPLRRKYGHEFLALNDVNFEVGKGETVGIIGKNGSGKSTLLKLITGVLAPTSGFVTVKGKISALLELGVGFNPELTGLENVYFNGMLMGNTRLQMDEKLDGILSFADIGEFLHQQVKTYSSGMFVKLAFAVAVNIEPDILIVDEALAVGDGQFVQKCLRKFEQFQRSGVTIVFVSHDMNSIKKNCRRVFLLDRGEIIDSGNPKEVVDVYNAILFDAVSAKARKNNRTSGKEIAGSRVEGARQKYGSGEAEIVDVELLNADGMPVGALMTGEEGTFRITVKAHACIEKMVIGITLRNGTGLDMYGVNTLYKDLEIRQCQPGDVVVVDFKQHMMLAGGEYHVNVAVNEDKGGSLPRLDWISDLIPFNIINCEQFLGVCNLNSDITINYDRKVPDV